MFCHFEPMSCPIKTHAMMGQVIFELNLLTRGLNCVRALETRYILLETVSKNRQSIRLLLILSKINSIILVLFKVYKLNSNKSGKGYYQVTRVIISGVFCVKLRFAILMSVFANAFFLVVIFPFFLKRPIFLECPLAFSHLFTLSALVPPKSLSARTPSSAKQSLNS